MNTKRLANQAEKNRYGYMSVCNFLAKDDRLHAKAKGIMLMILSMDETRWKFSAIGLSRYVKDGEKAILTALTELEECGYIKRTNCSKCGRFEHGYAIYEVPKGYWIEKALNTHRIPSKDEFLAFCDCEGFESPVDWGNEYDRLSNNGWKDGKGEYINNWEGYCKALEKKATPIFRDMTSFRF